MGRKGGGFRNPGMQNVMKQAQKMQTEMAKVQEEMATKTIETTGGGGAIKLTMNGNQEIVSLTIDPEVLEGNDTEMLQDLILATVNDGVKKSKEMMEEAMNSVTGGMPMPPGMGF
jgi:hypothetical protein